MEPVPDLDALDLALSRTADRRPPAPLDLRRQHWRRLRLAVGPLAWLLFVATLAVAAVLDRSWWLAGGLTLALGPGAVANLLLRRREVAALVEPGDLLGFERDYFAAQGRYQRSALLIEATLAGVFAVVAWQSGEAWRWSVPAVFAGLALLRGGVLLPYVERVHRDVGGDRPYGWSVHAIVFVLFLLLPLLLVFGALRRLWTRLGGRRGASR